MLSRNIWVCYRSFENIQPAWETEPADWLSEAERRECERYRDESRHRQWLAGRWLAKELLAEQLLPWFTEWKQIEILSRDGEGRAVRPLVHVEQKPQPWHVSISHSRRGALVGVSLNPAIRVGVDLAEPEDLNPQSLVFWFSAKERRRLRRGDARQAAACWAVKEAVYKAVGTGESFVPRKFEVLSVEGGAYHCRYEGTSLKDRSRITTWHVDGHIAVTAIVSETPAALREVPTIGGRMESDAVLARQGSVLVGIS